jgi:hypothetical protein
MGIDWIRVGGDRGALNATTPDPVASGVTTDKATTSATTEEVGVADMMMQGSGRVGLGVTTEGVTGVTLTMTGGLTVDVRHRTCGAVAVSGRDAMDPVVTTFVIRGWSASECGAHPGDRLESRVTERGRHGRRR